MTFNVKYRPMADVKYWATPNVKCFLPKTCDNVSLCDVMFAIGEHGNAALGLDLSTSLEMTIWVHCYVIPMIVDII